MEIHNIPPDLARIIFSLLPLLSLVNLCHTFDKRLLRLLSSRGLFEKLTLSEPIDNNSRLFLHTIRNVNELVLRYNLQLVPHDAMALLSLNPRVLELSDAIFHKYLLTNQEEKANTHEGDNQLEKPTIYFTALGIPNFALLTPRLESLYIKPRIEDLWDHKRKGRFQASDIDVPMKEAISLPPSLKLVKFDIISSFLFKKLGQFLPTAIQSIDINAKAINPVPMRSLFLHFTALQELSIDRSIIDSTALALPQSIKRLKLETLQPFPFEWLNRPETKTCSLTKLQLAISPAPSDHHLQHIDLNAHLPTSLVSLALLQHERSDKTLSPTFIKALPTSLIELNLGNLNHFQVSILSHLYNLETLKLHSKLPNVQIVHTGIEPDIEREDVLIVGMIWLPRRLKRLYLDFRTAEPSIDSVADLPLTLEYFQSQHCPLDVAFHIRMLRPKCKISILEGLDLFQLPNAVQIQNEFRHLLEPTLNWWVFYTTVIDHYASLGISIDLRISAIIENIPANPAVTTLNFTLPPDLRDPKPHTLRTTRRWMLPNIFPNLTSLNMKSVTMHDFLTRGFFPRNLTYLKLAKQPIFSEEGWSIPTLTYISSRGTFFPGEKALTFWNFPNLVHLNTPAWGWTPSDMKGRAFKRLRTKISGLNDNDVFNFLCTIDPANYPNVRLHIACKDTGALCPDLEADGNEKEEDFLRRRGKQTFSVLTRRLSEAKVSLAPSDDDDEKSLALDSLVGNLSVIPAIGL